MGNPEKIEILSGFRLRKTRFGRWVGSAGQFDVFEEVVVVGCGVILPEVDAPGFQSAWTAGAGSLMLLSRNPFSVLTMGRGIIVADLR